MMRMMMICVVITCSVHEDDDHVGDDVKSVTNDKKNCLLFDSVVATCSK